MIEFKIDEEKPVTTIYREGQEKCQIDYQHLRRCILDPNKDIGELAVGHLLFVLENHNGSFMKLDKQELQTFGDFLDSLQAGGKSVSKTFAEKQKLDQQDKSDYN